MQKHAAIINAAVNEERRAATQISHICEKKKKEKKTSLRCVWPRNSTDP